MAIAILLAALAAALQPTAPAGSCQAALGPIDEGTEEAALPGQVDGTTIRGRDGLVLLRQTRGDALITVRGGNFARADFRRDRLHNICFIGTDLSGTNWRGTDAAGVGFVRANLSGADLRGARLQGVLIRNANMENANGEGAVLAGGRLDGGWFDGGITRFNLDRADLTGFRFECGIMLDDGCPVAQGDPRISLRGAILTRANLFGYESLEGARIDETEVRLSQLADLAAAEIVGPIRAGSNESFVLISADELQAILPHISRDDRAAPSFDCGRAATSAERMICSEEGASLRPLDRQVAELYRAQARNSGEASAHRAWLSERDRCADFGCIEESYQRRKAILADRARRPQWLRPGAAILFVEPTINLAEAIRSDPLYHRLIPVIVAESWVQVAVRVNRDLSLDATGEAVGANGHSCSLDATQLRLDRTTGWYSAIPTEGPMRGRPVPVLLVRGDWIEVYRNGRADPSEPLEAAAGEYASCGARASFGDMLRLPVPVAEVQRRFEESNQR